jgi:hypothetical protein
MQTGTRCFDAVLHAVHRRREIDLYLADVHTELRRMAGLPRDARALAQCLGRRAAVVHAGAAQLHGFDERDLLAALRKRHGQRWPRLACTDDGRVDFDPVRHVHLRMSPRRRPGSLAPKNSRAIHCHRSRPAPG